MLLGRGLNRGGVGLLSWPGLTGEGGSIEVGWAY